MVLASRRNWTKALWRPCTLPSQCATADGSSQPHSSRIEACFHLPAVVVFSGHMVDQPERRIARFQPNLEPNIYAEIQERLDKLDAGFGYSSAACGSDILFLEAMLEREGEIHVVLPYEKRHFIEASVDRAPGLEDEI